MRWPELTDLQGDLLSAFAPRAPGFFLTGGAALVGFYLHHRLTLDLDLFTANEDLEEGVRALEEVARELGASLERVRTFPDHRRFLVRRGEEGVIVDLVRDRAPQIFPEKPTIDGVRIDPPEEILVNKLCAVLGRAEIRDLVDVYQLEKQGFSLRQAVVDAERKDGGMSFAQLAWVLSQIEIGDHDLPGGVDPAELRGYVADLVERLTAFAYPGP